jgi:ribose-phosphate pyrophosphokinase
VRERRCIIYDDIVDSAGTLCNAAEAMIKAGAAEVSAYVTHGVLSGAAMERVGASSLKELVVTDSIEANEQAPDGGKIRRISVAPLIGEAIRRIANEESVSKLFD